MEPEARRVPKVNLFQIFTVLERLGYDRYILDGNPLGWPLAITCSLFKPEESEPSIVVTASYGLQALRQAAKTALRKE